MLTLERLAPLPRTSAEAEQDRRILIAHSGQTSRWATYPIEQAQATAGLINSGLGDWAGEVWRATLRHAGDGQAAVYVEHLGRED